MTCFSLYQSALAISQATTKSQWHVKRSVYFSLVCLLVGQGSPSLGVSFWCLGWRCNGLLECGGLIVIAGGHRSNHANPFQPSASITLLTFREPKQVTCPSPMTRDRDIYSFCHEAIERVQIHDSTTTGRWSFVANNSLFTHFWKVFSPVSST